MAAPYEMIGKIKLIYELMTFPSGFTKREFVVTSDDNYPQDIKFVCKNEKCSLLDGFNPGGQVKVSFRIRGNEYKERYYVDLDVFKIEKMDSDDSMRGYDNQEPADAIPPDADLPF